ncbi:MAG: FtsX-like permease family protein [Bacteroidales bacterium]|nr:FtsX-like permease family protein [Bacteroidales bacterium]
MNLATARSAKRSREVGVRKVMGANKSNIFNQFMAESFFMSIFSMIIALLIVEIILPSFNLLIGKQLDLSLLLNIPLTISIIIICILVGFLSGSYPAFFLSNFKPLSVLKSNTISGTGNKTTLYLRRGLVIFQFAISAFLIIGSITVYKQLMFIQEKNLGFDKEQVMVINLSGRNARENVEVLKNDFLSMPEILSACATSVIPGERVHILTVRIPDIAEDNIEGNEEGDDVLGMRVMNADIDVAETFGLEIVDGRSFSKDFVGDPDNAFLLNEAAVREFELENPVGKRFEYLYGLEEPKAGHIVGIVKDFHYASLHTEVEPVMIHIFPRFYRYISVKLKTDNVQEVVKTVEEKWKKVSSDIPFDYFFLDASYDNLYKSEMNMGKIVTYFTALAILIACLGLFGLASYITEQRTKEIGIRKVMGASIISIMKTLSKEFVVLVIIANIIAWIPAWYFLNNWLGGFAFRTNISLHVFAITAVVSLFIALLTVSSLAWKTAKANPVDALKYE